MLNRRARKRIRRAVIFALIVVLAVSLIALARMQSLRNLDLDTSILEWAFKYNPPMQHILEVKAVKLDLVDGYFVMRDQTGVYFNVKDGIRVTVGQPLRAAHTLYMIGNSEILGPFVTDADTIPSQLQRLVPTYRIVNLGIGGQVVGTQTAQLKSLSLKRGDIVVFVDGIMDVFGLEHEEQPDADAMFKRYHTAIQSARQFTSAHGATFYHFRQPVSAYPMRRPDVWDKLEGPPLIVPPAMFLDYSHTTVEGNALVTRQIYDAIWPVF